MSYRTQKFNFFLLGLTAVLVFFVWLELQRDNKQQHLFGISAAQVQRIVIQHRDKPPIQLQRQNGGWHITTPLQGPADKQRIRSLLNYLRVPVSKSFAPQQSELSQYGLAVAQTQLSYNDRNIVFGNTNPLSGERYILFNQQVHLVRDGIYHHLLSDAGAFYDAQLLHNEAPLRSIRYPGQSFERLKEHWQTHDNDNQWTQERMATLASTWKQARAAQVKAYEQGEPLGTVSLGFSDLRTTKFEILSMQDELLLLDKEANVTFYFKATVIPHLLPGLHLE